MDYSNVQLWFAKRKEDDKIVVINEVDRENKDTYNCPLCGTEVIPRMGEKQSWCFAHLDKSKCNSESMIHWWFKNKFLIVGDKFIVESDVSKEYVVKEVFIEKVYDIEGKTYKPDISILTETNDVIFFEMNYHNKKKIEDYIDIWIKLNNTVVEINLKTLINSNINDYKIFKALYCDGECFNIKNKDREYYDTIGKYKEQLIWNEEYHDKKEEIEKLNWFWNDIQKYKLGKKTVEEVITVAQAIKSEDIREIIVSILKRSNCNQIIKEYMSYLQINFNKEYEELIKKVNKQYLECNVAIPHKIYDRLYKGIEIYILYKDYFIYEDNYMVNKNTFNIDDLIDKINKKEEYIKTFEKRKIIFNKFKNYKLPINYLNMCDNIEICNIPNINYYYSYFYSQDRLYLNNFKNAQYGEYITVMDCESEEKIEKYISQKLGSIDDYFNEEQVMEMNSFVKLIKDNFTTKYIDVFAKIDKNIFNIEFYIHYSEGDLYKTIFLINISKENYHINEESFDKIKNIFTKVNKEIDIYKYLKKINIKYKKYTEKKWNININIKDSIYNNSICELTNTIKIKNINDEYFSYCSKVIIDYLNDKINLAKFKEYFANEISNQIRNYIYKI